MCSCNDWGEYSVQAIHRYGTQLPVSNPVKQLSVLTQIISGTTELNGFSKAVRKILLFILSQRFRTLCNTY